MPAICTGRNVPELCFIKMGSNGFSAQPFLPPTTWETVARSRTLPRKSICWLLSPYELFIELLPRGRQIQLPETQDRIFETEIACELSRNIGRRLVFGLTLAALAELGYGVAHLVAGEVCLGRVEVAVDAQIFQHRFLSRRHGHMACEFEVPGHCRLVGFISQLQHVLQVRVVDVDIERDGFAFVAGLACDLAFCNNMRLQKMRIDRLQITFPVSPSMMAWKRVVRCTAAALRSSWKSGVSVVPSATMLFSLPL